MGLKPITYGLEGHCSIRLSYKGRNPCCLRRWQGSKKHSQSSIGIAHNILSIATASAKVHIRKAAARHIINALMKTKQEGKPMLTILLLLLGIVLSETLKLRPASGRNICTPGNELCIAFPEILFHIYIYCL